MIESKIISWSASLTWIEPLIQSLAGKIVNLR
ncbi:hypothetical protein [Methylomonas albis]|nr:hypothetical protein [Methylomonas albis]